MRSKFLIIMAFMLCSCDEGRIFETEIINEQGGLTVRVEIVGASGADRWFSGYSLAVAGFGAGNEYALISKNIELDAEGNCSASLSGITAAVQNVELCIIDRLRRRVVRFESAECTRGGSLVLLSEGADFSPEAAIQHEIFNTTCINCHGGASYAAAGLNLTEGYAFNELTGVGSVKMTGKLRVSPGQPDESVLYRILVGNESEGWKYDHSVEITAQEKLDLIKNWIKAQ